MLNQIVRASLRVGLSPPHTYLLTVHGRKSGALYSTPVRLIEQDGKRWLVAPYGEVAWVRNARGAAGSARSRFANRDRGDPRSRRQREVMLPCERRLKLPWRQWQVETPGHCVFLARCVGSRRPPELCRALFMLRTPDDLSLFGRGQDLKWHKLAALPNRRDSLFLCPLVMRLTLREHSVCVFSHYIAVV
jgi:hypothetical protein